MANGFSYWQGKQVGAKELRENAEYTYFDDMQQALGRIQEVRIPQSCLPTSEVD